MQTPDGAVRLTPSQADVDSVIVVELQRRLQAEQNRVAELALLVRHYQGEVLDLQALLSTRGDSPDRASGPETAAGE